MVRPTLEECTAYATKKALVYCDPEDFWNYYESIGWKVGRGPNAKPMVKWRNAMAGWNARNKSRGRKPRVIPIEGDPGFRGRF